MGGLTKLGLSSSEMKPLYNTVIRPFIRFFVTRITIKQLNILLLLLFIPGWTACELGKDWLDIFITMMAHLTDRSFATNLLR